MAGIQLPVRPLGGHRLHGKPQCCRQRRGENDIVHMYNLLTTGESVSESQLVCVFVVFDVVEPDSPASSADTVKSSGAATTCSGTSAQPDTGSQRGLRPTRRRSMESATSSIDSRQLLHDRLDNFWILLLACLPAKP